MSKRARESSKKTGRVDLERSEATQIAVQSTRIAFLEHQLVELEVLACQEGDGRVVVSARKQAGEFRREIDELRAAKRRRPRKPKGDQVAEVLAETRRLRMAAAEAGSFIAAANLLKLERDLLAQQAAERKAAEDERLAHLDEAAIVAMLVESLGSLPADLRARVRDAVFAPVH